MSWLLLYPTPTRSGLPNQGLQILYEILNERPDAVAERAYAPWVDMEAAMRAAGVPLFSLESHLPARGLRRPGLQPVGRAGLHQRAQPHRPGRGGRSRRPAHRGGPDRGGRRPLRLQPRAPGRLRRLLRARRRGGGSGRDQRCAGRHRPPRAGRSPRRRAGPLLEALARVPGVYVPSCYEAGSTSLSAEPGAWPAGRPRLAGTVPRVGGHSRRGGEAHHRRPRRAGPTHDANWCRSSRWSTTG